MNRSFRRLRCRCKDNIKVGKEKESEDWIYRVVDRTKRRVFVNTETQIDVPLVAGNFSTS